VSIFGDLFPTPEELAAVDDAIAEVEALEEAGLPYETEDGYPGGPWQDGGPDVSHLNATLDQVQGSEGQRQIEDQFQLPKTSEERWAEALDRVARGTFTPGVAYREPGHDYGCQQGYDEFGRCAARYSHDAATAGGEASEAWVRTLRSNQETRAALDDALGELASDPGPGPSHEALLRELGLS
jgi:hypothetical protein